MQSVNSNTSEPVRSGIKYLFDPEKHANPTIIDGTKKEEETENE